MCLILFALNEHPEYKLIVASNRDEFYNRPTADATFWSDHPNVLAGRDLTAYGTWMGVSKFGRIAMLTNYRDLSHIIPDAPSRGDLVADYLIRNDLSEKDYLDHLMINGKAFNGFNLFFGSREQLFYYSNVSGQHEMLKEGLFGVSNHLLDTKWPKVERGKEKMRGLLEKGETSPEAFFDVLLDDIKAPDNLLPDTGVGLELERMLSPIFIKSPEYGSRCSTVVMADKKGTWHFYERAYDVKDSTYRTNEFIFQELKSN